MLQQMTDRIVDNQIKNKKISEEDRELYQYGYRLLMLEAVNIAILVLIGVIFRCLEFMILYSVIYIPLRSYSGGYHASTPARCSVFSALLELLIAVLLKSSVYELLVPGIYIAAVFAQIIIWLRSPVEAVHKPLTQKQKAKYRLRARAILAAEAVVLLICINRQMNAAGFVIGASHTILAAMLLLPEKKISN